MSEHVLLDWLSPLRMLWLCIAMLGIAPVTVVLAEPCTLYKTQDIARAQENCERYPWAKSIVDGWKRSVAFAMQQDREFFDGMITERTNWTTYGQNCPACVGEKSSMGECGLWNWNVARPDEIQCKYCGTVYPNAEYPETGAMTCAQMGQTFEYYETPEERAHPGENPSPYALQWCGKPIHTSFSGVIRTKQTGWCLGQVLPMAKLYALTGDVMYAEHAAWIIDRFAQVYPKWLFHTYDGTFADCPPAEAARNLGQYGGGGKFAPAVIVDPFRRHQKDGYALLGNGFWGGGRFGCSGSDGGSILSLTVAYDLIRDAAYEDGSPVISAEMAERIENDLIIACTDDCENWKDINNKCGRARVMSAASGIMFQRPESVRWALGAFEQLLANCFHSDGFCMESPSYSGMHLGEMRDIPEILRGYTDPEGYVDGEGKRFDNLNPFDDVKRYRLGLESMVRMLAPGRRAPVIGDTHYRAGLSPVYAEILADRYGHEYASLLEAAQGGTLDQVGSEYALWYRDPDMTAEAQAELPLHTEWFPGWRVGVLRGGQPQGGTALYLNGYQYHGHRHYDSLGLIYYAYGKEIASDRGYIWDDPRNAWTKSTLSHNLVTVDGQSQQSKGQLGSSLDFFGEGPGLEVIQAHNDTAYAQCEKYQRTMALVQRGNEETYAVDFFRVNGGKLQRYGFQCNGELVDLSCTAPEAVGDEIKWLSNLRASFVDEPFTVTWQDGDTKMDLTVVSPVDRLLVADAPGWRSDSGSDLHAPPIQQIFAERVARDGVEGVSSNYAAVMAPYVGEKSPVKSARLIVSERHPDSQAVVVELDGHTDYIMSAAAADEVNEFGPVTLRGQFGFVSVDANGKVLKAYVLNGTGVSCGEVELELPSANVTLAVKAVEGNTFKLAESLPEGLAATGCYLLAGTTGFEIETMDESSITVRDYPAIECDEVTVLNSAWVEFR